jgi:hypothetical protein
MVDLNWHEAETADTAKEHLQPIGTPLLGQMEFLANSAKVQSDVAKAAIATLCRYSRINPKILQCVPASAGSEAVRTGSMGVIAQL